MVLLNLKDQKDIVKVIEYLVEINHKNNTVQDVRDRFGLNMDEYRMCCNLAMPTISMVNMEGRYKAIRGTNRAIRKDIAALYAATKDEDGIAARGVKLLYDRYCNGASPEDDESEDTE